MNSEPLYLVLICGFLVFIRIVFALRLTPFLGGNPMPLLACIGLAAILSVLITPILVVSGEDAKFFDKLFVLILLEGAIGICLGLMARVAFSVFEMSGNLIQISTLSIFNIEGNDSFDSSYSSKSDPFARFYIFVGIGSFLLMNGHHGMFSALINSFKCVPLGGSSLNLEKNHAFFLELADGTLNLFAAAFGWAIMLAVPIFVAGLAAQLISAIIQRIMPSLGLTAGTQTLRALLVHLVIIFVLGAAVSVAVGFLQESLKKLTVFV